MSDKPTTFGFSVFGNRFFFTPKFTFLTVVFIVICIALGMWQLHEEKNARKLVDTINSRTVLNPITADDLQKNSDWEYFPIQMRGRFDNQHQILLTHRVYQGGDGYFLLTPFIPLNSSTVILVNRGWIPLSAHPATMPQLAPVTQIAAVSGILILQPFSWSFANMHEEKNMAWPWQVPHVNIDQLSKVLGHPVQPYIVLMSGQNDNGFVRDWLHYAETLNPQQEHTNAIQWFSLAALIFLIFFFINLERF